MKSIFIFLGVVVVLASAFPKPVEDGESINVKNVIDAPIVCPPNQQLDANGRCREVWRLGNDRNVIDVPIVCPPGQKPDQNGKCREQWLADMNAFVQVDQNEINAPVECPSGQRLDENGRCTWRLPGFQIMPKMF